MPKELEQTNNDNAWTHTLAAFLDTSDEKKNEKLIMFIFWQNPTSSTPQNNSCMASCLPSYQLLNYEQDILSTAVGVRTNT